MQEDVFELECDSCKRNPVLLRGLTFKVEGVIVEYECPDCGLEGKAVLVYATLFTPQLVN